MKRPYSTQRQKVEISRDLQSHNSSLGEGISNWYGEPQLDLGDCGVLDEMNGRMYNEWAQDFWWYFRKSIAIEVSCCWDLEDETWVCSIWYLTDFCCCCLSYPDCSSYDYMLTYFVKNVNDICSSWFSIELIKMTLTKSFFRCLLGFNVPITVHHWGKIKQKPKLDRNLEAGIRAETMEELCFHGFL